NQWGLVKGEILEIGNDIEIVDNNPVFKVLCKINIKHLQLNNGFKGHLKKGMTLNARFELAERTLFNLLYDKVDDWMNPGTNN
ncbi:MAG: secretion protein HlyD, partial [Flavobacteriaceae bacterium]